MKVLETTEDLLHTNNPETALPSIVVQAAGALINVVMGGSKLTLSLRQTIQDFKEKNIEKLISDFSELKDEATNLKRDAEALGSDLSQAKEKLNIVPDNKPHSISETMGVVTSLIGSAEILSKKLTEMVLDFEMGNFIPAVAALEISVGAVVNLRSDVIELHKVFIEVRESIQEFFTSQEFQEFKNSVETLRGDMKEFASDVVKGDFKEVAAELQKYTQDASKGFEDVKNLTHKILPEVLEEAKNDMKHIFDKPKKKQVSSPQNNRDHNKGVAV